MTDAVEKPKQLAIRVGTHVDQVRALIRLVRRAVEAGRDGRQTIVTRLKLPVAATG